MLQARVAPAPSTKPRVHQTLCVCKGYGARVHTFPLPCPQGLKIQPWKDRGPLFSLQTKNWHLCAGLWDPLPLPLGKLRSSILPLPDSLSPPH